MRITAEQIDEVEAVLARLRRDMKEVYELDRRLALVERPDGYRASVRPMEGSRSATDDEGEPLPPHSDSTGTTAVARIMGHLGTASVRAEVKVMNAAFAEVLTLARQLDGARDRAMVPDKHHVIPDGCRVHEGYELGWEPVYASGRCRWCYDFWLAEEIDPPKVLLVERGKGRRISEAMVETALAHRHSQRARRRRRKAG